MEASSSALDQDRVHGIEYAIGGFTNLTQDHLDYHKTFENYLAAKKIMFTRSKFAVVNADDPHSFMLLDGLNLPAMRYGVRAGVSFTFHQTGARFVKDGRTYMIRRGLQHGQAARAGLDFRAGEAEKEPSFVEKRPSF